MECGQLTESALGRLLGEATSSEREELEVHLAGCASCRADVASLEEAWETLAADADAPVTPEFRAQTIELMEDEIARRRIRSFRSRPPVRRALAQAAAVLVAAGIGYVAAKGGIGVPTKSANAPASTGAAEASWPDLTKNPRLTNVSYRTDADGKVSIAFDASS
ncbi:MAG TPA: zf-HC2 domain-containing protein, partial [Thermoanaerobaculia bacterium]